MITIVQFYANNILLTLEITPCRVLMEIAYYLNFSMLFICSHKTNFLKLFLKFFKDIML